MCPWFCVLEHLTPAACASISLCTCVCVLHVGPADAVSVTSMVTSPQHTQGRHTSYTDKRGHAATRLCMLHIKTYSLSNPSACVSVCVRVC